MDKKHQNAARISASLVITKPCHEYHIAIAAASTPSWRYRMDNRNIRSVAIIGNSLAGWMSAAYLSTMLGKSVSITLLGGEKGDGVSFNEVSIPPLKAFHQQLGLNEVDVIAKCQGSIKLGTQFVNWGSLGNRYFHPHGSYGAEFDVVPLHQWWLKSRASEAVTPSLDDLSMAWALASQTRFIPPVPDRRLIHATHDYAYHLDGTLYANYLASFAKTQGVIEIQGEINSVSRDNESGFVTHVALEDGQTIAADLFLDCSGASAVLKPPSSETGFDDWSAYLPCNRIASVSCVKAGEFSPYTKSTARDAGWQWRIPLQDRTSMGYVFSSDFLSDEDAASTLMDNLDGRALGDQVMTTFANGKSQKPFEKNVVALGDAVGFLEPLEATSLHMVQAGLTRLLALWPTRDCDPLIVKHYNDLTDVEWNLARDFLILYYKATTRTDMPLWRLVKDMEIPDSLQTRLDHWLTSGRLVSPRPELFQTASWLSVLVGQGLMPQGYDPLADARADRVDYEARLQGLQRIIQETASQMPLHQEWIDKHARGPRR
jgi:tryptophan 7-halogenase